MDGQEQKTKRRWLRLAWIIAGIVVLAGGGLVALNMSAAKANGADAPQEQSAEADGAEGEEEKEAVQW